MFRFDRPPAPARASLRRAGAALLCALLPLAAAGCGRAAPGTDAEDAGVAPGTAANDAKAVFDWVTQNPIEIEYIEDPENHKDERTETDRSWLRISGLADADAERRINDALYEKYLEIAAESELPPYRGVKALIPEGATPYRDRISCDVQANFNNLLSVCFVRFRDYALPDADGRVWDEETGSYPRTEYVGECFPMTFDLATGELFGLADMFTGGAEDLKFADEALLAKLRAAGDDDEDYFEQLRRRNPVLISLVGPYEPIATDQKFYVTHDAKLALVFDHETPRFVTGTGFGYLGYMDLPIDAENVRARMKLFRRLADAEQAALYTAEPPFARRLLSVFDYAASDTLPQYGNAEYEGVPAEIAVHVGCALPPAIEARMLSMLEPKPAELAILRALRAKYGAQGCNARISLNAMRCGRYFSVLRYFSVYAAAAAHQAAEVRNWDADGPAEIGLADIFAEGFDYEALLRDALDEALAERGGLYENGAPRDAASARAEKERLLAGLLTNGANIEDTTLALWTPPTQTAAGGAAGEEACLLSLPYQDIGFENLRLFGEFE